jgi:hypothetical protein
MPKKEFDFENEANIDLDNLHEEWRTHASIRYKYASEVAYLDKVCKQQRKLIEVNKAKLKESTGKLILEIKENNPKFTVQQIDATIAGHGEIKEPEKELSDSQDKLISLEYDLNMAKNALQVFDDKKTALENEVKLWIRDYYSSPTEERQIDPSKSVATKGRDEASGKARNTMNRKRTRK